VTVEQYIFIIHVKKLILISFVLSVIQRIQEFLVTFCLVL